MLKWLSDDYVKFMRFAQMKTDGVSYRMAAPDDKVIEHAVAGVESGIVGVITDHSWLDNPTLRGMRQSLMRSFERISCPRPARMHDEEGQGARWL